MSRRDAGATRNAGTACRVPTQQEVANRRPEGRRYRCLGSKAWHAGAQQAAPLPLQDWTCGNLHWERDYFVARAVAFRIMCRGATWAGLA
jgi:hypothetical protein